MANKGSRIKVLQDYPLPSRLIKAGEYDIDSPDLDGAGNWLVAVGVAELIKPEIKKKGGKDASL